MLTKVQMAMLKQLAAGEHHLRYANGIGARAAITRTCQRLIDRGLIVSKTTRVDEGSAHPWTRWDGYVVTPAGFALLSDGLKSDEAS